MVGRLTQPGCSAWPRLLPLAAVLLCALCGLLPPVSAVAGESPSSSPSSSGAAAATPCETSPVCRHDPSGSYRTLSLSTAGDCCAACNSDALCAAFTFWAPSHCRLFKDESGLGNQSGCISGRRSAPKPRLPNFIYVFPDTLYVGG